MLASQDVRSESPIACCANPAYVYDPQNNEIACSSCGCVNTDETELAKLLSLSNKDERSSTLLDHMIAASHMLVELGTDHAMRSISNIGLTMELNNKRLRDIHGKRVIPQLHDGYCSGQFMERNGYFYTNEDGKQRFKIDYTRDTPFIRCKQKLFQIQVKRDRNPAVKVAATNELKRMYSKMVMDFIPKLIAEISDYNGSVNEFNDKFSEESEQNIDQLVDTLRLYLVANRRQNITV